MGTVVGWQCSCTDITCRPSTHAHVHNMIGKPQLLVLVALLGGNQAARQLRGNAYKSAASAPRGERSLLNTFPFNAQGAADDHHHHHHHEEHDAPARIVPSQDLAARGDRQGSDDVDVSFPAVAAAGPALTARGALTKWRWWRRPSTTRSSSATTPTTAGATPPTSPTTSPNRRRSARRTSGRTASSTTNRSPSTRRLRSAASPWSRTVTSRDPRSVGPSTSPSAGPSRRSTTLRTTWLSARPSRTRSARTRRPATPPRPSAPSGPGRCAP